jgi:CRISPR type I-E-associated protein CasB/Cse2
MQPEQLAEEHIRAVRRAYDALSPGDRAVLKRCRDAGEIAMEGAFWRVVRAAPEEARSRLAEVVVCFPAAEQSRRAAGFSPGIHFHRALRGNREKLTDGGALRFRQLLQARGRDELVHRLRRLLTFADAPVDWGVLGSDVFYWNDRVRRRWAQDFYSNVKEMTNG